MSLDNIIIHKRLFFSTFFLLNKKGELICAASVYFTPTVKALNGRYGARHRAAVGISEMVDAVTVVVSEETGRISFAIKGELIAVNRDNFARNLSDYLS